MIRSSPCDRSQGFVIRQVLGPFHGEAIDNSVKEELVEFRCRIVGRVARKSGDRNVELSGEGVADGGQAVFLDHWARCAFKNSRYSVEGLVCKKVSGIWHSASTFGVSFRRVHAGNASTGMRSAIARAGVHVSYEL